MRPPLRLTGLAALATLLLAFAPGCRTAAPPPAPPLGVRPVQPPPFLEALPYDPSRDLGPLFQDVQVARVFGDSKTFVDALPLEPPKQIAAAYAAARDRAGFSLQAFVAQHFQLPRAVGIGAGEFHSDTTQTMEQHIAALWPVLTRSPDTADARSSLLPLPEPYVVPGGRFREVYYWDSYFTMQGLVASGHTELVKSMLDNFAWLIRKVGRIPNGNRSYYLSRSQPPYFAAMVGLYARATDSTQALPYLEALEMEHAFWMEGAEGLAPGEAHRRVVRLPEGAVLNRYWDDLATPRPESFREDYTLGQSLPEGRREAFYRNVRSTAESGWDFSSRWLRDPGDLRTLETTDLLPVDLNSLLYHAERTIAALRLLRARPGDAAVAAVFAGAAEARRRALLAAAYDSGSGFFYDVRWHTGERVTDRPTLAAAAPLYFGLATPDQGRAVAARLEREFLAPGGFATTLIVTHQQWDAPNGWAPLEWLAIEGVARYGRPDLAATARGRWLALNRATYRATGRMMEKYDVTDLSQPAGGGEYPAQDGFGWTNGVALALIAQEGGGSAIPRPPEDEAGFDGALTVNDEMLVRGVRVVRELPGYTHGRVTANLALQLGAHVERSGAGQGLVAEVGFKLAADPDTVRGPDLAVMRRPPLDAEPRGFVDHAPDLAIEVLSPGDGPGEVLAKVADWINAGTRLVWVIDPERWVARVYRQDGTETVVTATGSLGGEDVLRGFSCPLDSIL